MVYTIGYGIIRFVVESFRNNSNVFSWIPFFTTAQLISLAGIITGLSLLIWSLIFPDQLEVDEENITRLKIKKK